MDSVLRAKGDERSARDVIVTKAVSRCGRRSKPRLEKEFRVIEMKKLAGYFLVVSDISDFCKREKILSQGRGSAANSVVCYASASRPSTRSRTSFSSSVSCPKNTSSIPTSTSTCRRATTAKRSSSTFIKNMADAASGMTANVISLSRQIRRSRGRQDVRLRRRMCSTDYQSSIRTTRLSKAKNSTAA